ncbi:MAG: hypothetical protein D6677_11000, partial [Calditrichaeota bacterium]
MKYLFILFLSITWLVSSGFAADAKFTSGNVFEKSTIIGQTTRMNVNKVDLSFDNQGNTGLDATSYYPKGTTLSFLFAGGISMSGYVNGDLRTAWAISASRIDEFQPGTWGMDPDDARATFYSVTKDDGFGSEAYQKWATAVELGAAFQDLNGDGVYDPNVDKPDIIGDKVIWNVFNDGTPASNRALGTLPMGVEVQQQVWAFDRGDFLGDVVFIRYRIINQGGEDIDDLITSCVMDPDLGDYRDDLIGCDTTLSIGFIYNDGDDGSYGANPPAFGLDFFQGAVVESPGDTAFRFLGPGLGVDTLYDMKNLGLTSFMYYIQSHPTLGDPGTAQEARWYQEGGLDKTGTPIDPLNFGFGKGADASTNPRFLYSGDPVAGTGWLDDPPDDKRFMVNSGPFQLAAGDTQDVVIAYIVAQGSSALNSVKLLKEEDVFAQTAYDANFFVAGPPPAASFTTRSLDQQIDFIIDMRDWFDYDVTDKLFNRQVFKGFRVYQFNSPNTSDKVNGVENAKVIAAYDFDDEYGDIYEDSKDGRRRVWDGLNNLDPNDFADPNTRFMRISVKTDAFNNDEPLVNGKEYYFAIVPHSIDVNHILPNDLTTAVDNDWVFLSGGGFLEPSRGSSLVKVIPGSSTHKPFREISTTDNSIEKLSGTSEGFVTVDVVNHDDLTSHDYEVSFFDDAKYWRVKDATTGEIKIDSVGYQGKTGQEWNFPIVDGVSVRVFDAVDSIKSVDTSGTVWLVGTGTDASHELSDSAKYGYGIDYAKYVFPEIANVKRDEYFPVKIVADTVDRFKGYYYRSASFSNFSRFTGMSDIFLAAYDISDPDNPRQLNIVFNSIRGDIKFGSTGITTATFFVSKSSYDTSGVYPDSSDKMRDAYLALRFKIKGDSDSLYKAGPMEITVIPTEV